MAEESAKYMVHVFGKEGCAKCSMLNRRLDTLLASPPWQGRFVKKYEDLGTEDGLVAFCQAQCLNPSRVPAMLVTRVETDGRESYVENLNPGAADPVCRRSRLYQYLGLQTDYSPEGKGIITPEMLEAILQEAAGAAGA
jgi:hypothetical protein